MKENRNNPEEDLPLVWELLNTEHLVRDKWIDFRKETYRFPDGTVFEPFYTYSRRDYAVIVARDTEGRYITVRQFRQGLKEVTNEFVAGGIERKDGKQYGDRGQSAAAENALMAAKRELEEESGYVSDNWRPLLAIPSNATIADNYAYLFAADNCRRVTSQHLDETEFLNVRLVSEEELTALIHEGRFQQAMHILAFMLARNSF